tara:strand:- start:15874 stop:16704 length:831 start_codon:yes stop_codon:yes gene_type:complete
MSKINQVRQTVLSILNKNNYGYISPIDYNLFAKQAQLDLFEQYFYDYNKQIVAENLRYSGTGNADIARQLNEVIETFTQYRTLASTTGSAQTFTLPSDWYTLVEIEWVLTDGGDVIITSNLAERVNEYNIRKLLRSNLTAPSKEFPAYVFSQMGRPVTEGPGTGSLGDLGNQITLYPAATAPNALKCNLTWIRYPKEPNWTSVALSNGVAIFDDSDPLYQDFELPDSDIPNLINKILQYSGMSIREIAALQFGQLEEQKDNAGEDPMPKTQTKTKK